MDNGALSIVEAISTGTNFSDIHYRYNNDDQEYYTSTLFFFCK